MPDPVAQIGFAGSSPNYMSDSLRYGVSGNPSVNSTIPQTFRIEEAQTGFFLRMEPSPAANLVRGVWSKLEYYRAGLLFRPAGPVTIPVTDPQSHENPYVRSPGLPTTVLPGVIASNWNDLAGGGLSEKIYQRLLELAGLNTGWNGEGSLGMNASSLWSFISFWKQIRHLSAEPELVLTPRGHVQAEWSKNKRHYLEIDFRGNGANSYFALIDGRKAVIDGAASIKEIISIITSYQNGIALTWQYEQEK